MKSYSTLGCEIWNRVLTVTLTRPERMNAFTVTMADELVDVFNWASQEDDVGAVVVTGAGRSFCAGMDLSVSGNVFGLNEDLRPTLADMREKFLSPEIVHGVRDTGGRVVLAIYDCNKPVIAAINGDAVGVGATMTLPMDFRLAAETARIGFVFGRIGIVAEACSSWFLPRLVGIEQALEWCYSAEIIPAPQAQKAGLIRAVVPLAELLAEAHKLAHGLIDNRSSVAIAMTRQMLWRNAALSGPAEAHRIDSLVVFYLSQLDGREGVTAFREKRKPRFSSLVSKDMPPIYPWWSDS
jgi:enoyl-CoA hydratase/carnithine racemase